ncbi:hypothetical protein [Dokdonella sp.]|uniref:hypothetical protein n=1 Tax=Dokdonella sp. TaxID=2291710 RepID=UPI002DD6B846|nr:hypothetical protein [Dokdonella sp.]
MPAPIKIKQAVILNAEVVGGEADISRHTGRLVIHSFRLPEGNTEAWGECGYELDSFWADNCSEIIRKLDIARQASVRHLCIKDAGAIVGAIIGPGGCEQIDAITLGLRGLQ